MSLCEKPKDHMSRSGSTQEVTEVTSGNCTEKTPQDLNQLLGYCYRLFLQEVAFLEKYLIINYSSTDILYLTYLIIYRYI